MPRLSFEKMVLRPLNAIKGKKSQDRVRLLSDVDFDGGVATTTTTINKQKKSVKKKTQPKQRNYTKLTNETVTSFDERRKLKKPAPKPPPAPTLPPRGSYKINHGFWRKL